MIKQLVFFSFSFVLVMIHINRYLISVIILSFLLTHLTTPPSCLIVVVVLN